MEGLADKVVLVTGGSSGIGEACARRLAVEGCAVMVAGRDEAKTSAVAESLLPAGRHGWVTGDVRDVGDCRALVAATMDRYGQLDVLVHCAGVWDERPTLDVQRGGLGRGRRHLPQGRLLHDAGGPRADDRGRRRRDRRHRQRLRPPRRARRRGLRRRQGRRSSTSCARWRTTTGPTACASCAVSPGIIETPMLDRGHRRGRATPRPTPAGRPTATPSAGSAIPRRWPPWSPSSPATRRASSPATPGWSTAASARDGRAGRRRPRPDAPPGTPGRRGAAHGRRRLGLQLRRHQGRHRRHRPDDLPAVAAHLAAALLRRHHAAHARGRRAAATGCTAACSASSCSSPSRRRPIGLQWTTPGKSGFITSLDIVMVPFLYWLVARRSPGLDAGRRRGRWPRLGFGFLSLRGGSRHGARRPAHARRRPRLRRADHRHRLLRAAHAPGGAGAHADRGRRRACSSSSRRSWSMSA